MTLLGPTLGDPPRPDSGPMGRPDTFLYPVCIRFVSGFHSWRLGLSDGGDLDLLGWGGCAGSELII